MIGLDQYGQLRDFYYPYVGMENHAGYGTVHRLGIMIDGEFTWLQNPDWEIVIGYAADTLVSDIRMANRKAGIELAFTDAVYNEKDIFLRRIVVNNILDRPRKIKLFFHAQFKINGTGKRDTAFFDPENHTVIHYEGRRVFAISLETAGAPFEEYSVGNYGIEGKEGTWKDAEDGWLEGNAIEHGAVDSVVAKNVDLPPADREELFYWIAAGKSFADVLELNRCVKEKTPGHILKTTADFWHSWANKKAADFADLEDDIVSFYKKSLLIMRTQAGNNGDIIASGDSDMYQYGKDTYAYVWPRDASFIVIALDQAGYWNNTRPFFEFANEAISKDGYFYHKYQGDRSVGSSWHPWIVNGQKRLAIQEDETALVIYSLWKHYEATLDLEFIESIYNSLIKKAAGFILGYWDEAIEMPKPSYDIWEQDFAVSTFTCACVAGGLEAAGKFAELLGKKAESRRYVSAAQKIRKGIVKYLYNEKNNFFRKSLFNDNGQLRFDDRIDLSSFYGVFYFNILDRTDERMRKAFETVKARLAEQSAVGGAVRYEGDEFHRLSPEAAPNPWFITTFWKAQFEIASARNFDELETAKAAMRWAMRFASPAGLLSEQIRSDTGEPLSASPLTWSHAEFAALVNGYIEKYQELK